MGRLAWCKEADAYGMALGGRPDLGSMGEADPGYRGYRVKPLLLRIYYDFGTFAVFLIIYLSIII